MSRKTVNLTLDQLADRVRAAANGDGPAQVAGAVRLEHLKPSTCADEVATFAPCAVPLTAIFGHLPLTRNWPSRLPDVSGSQSPSEAIASLIVASVSWLLPRPVTSTRLLPDASATVPSTT